MRRTPALLAAFVLAAVLASPALASATIVIQNNNEPGVGFNDLSPAVPVGGNGGTTLGEQRLIAFQHAADIWGATLDSNATIVILASFEPLTCTDTSATLGSAGALNVYANFANAPVPNTWYPVALASRLAGVRLQTSPDIRARFNVSLGEPGCLTGTGWYLGLDTNHGNQIDLVTVLLHEFAHGLGFQQFSNLNNGVLLGSSTLRLPDVYLRKLFDKSLNKYWDQMNNPQRAASAVNARRVVWDGSRVTARVREVLSPGTPVLYVSSPASTRGYYPVGRASFGAALSSPGVSGALVRALDPADAAGASTFDACSPLTNGAAVAGNVVLVDRGTCTFVVKVKNAQNAGATAVVVADNAAGSPPAGLGGSDSTIVIPAVRITQADGLTIKSALPSGVDVTLGVDMTVRQGADESDRAVMYAPNPLEPGSSISHWETIASPNQLMEPAISGDLTHSVSGVDLTLDLMRDIGWYADADLDTIEDSVDNCPSVANADQANRDGDAFGDACDTDNDNDGVEDSADNCWLVPNPDQANNDGDAYGDACDDDDDNDGVLDVADNCQFVPNADQANNDEDAWGDACDDDDDNDTVLDAVDACPLAAPALGLDADRDGCTDTLPGLKGYVSALPAPPYAKNGMLAKLTEAEGAVARGDSHVAVSKLSDFINQVEGLRGRHLSDTTADLLMQYAWNLMELLGGAL